jgi:hypothetical protein
MKVMASRFQGGGTPVTACDGGVLSPRPEETKMAVDDVRIRARQRLEELIGVDEAAYVVSDRPAGGWDALVTKEHLALELAALREEARALHSDALRALEKELRSQTWRLATALLATVTVITGLLRYG